MFAVKASPFSVSVPSDTGNVPDVRLFLSFACRWQNRAGYFFACSTTGNLGTSIHVGVEPRKTSENLDPIGRSQDFLDS
jgi:hypothetical protein